MINSKVEAQRRANTLVKQLGEGWETDVWNNCGWHYSATKNNSMATVSKHGEFYTCLINDGSTSGYSSGDTRWTTNFRSECPMEAYLYELKSMKGVLVDIKLCYDRLENL